MTIWGFCERLDELKSLGLDWNGYRAAPISLAAIEAAKQVATNLWRNGEPAPEIVPMTRGRLQFEWNAGPKSLELEFGDAGLIHYLKFDSDHDLVDEGSLSMNQSVEIRQLLDWFLTTQPC